MPATKTMVIRSSQAMWRLGQWLGERLEPGDFIGLIGELGAGKTVLVRGIAKGAGVPESEVASPSFAIVYPYRGRLPLYHADFYRVADEEELFATGFYDLLGADGAVVVEWVDHVPQAIPSEYLMVRIIRVSQRSRRVELEAKGRRAEELLEAAALFEAGR
jgi:tRNA threonylcarbamoyladenosine biosynthesis protein TsaE